EIELCDSDGKRGIHGPELYRVTRAAGARFVHRTTPFHPTGARNMTGGFRLLNSLADLPATQWDALGGAHLQPCLSHAWLHALEATGSVGGASGWRPRHATLWRGGELVAAMPLYEKTHSYGEYVFD